MHVAMVITYLLIPTLAFSQAVSNFNSLRMAFKTTAKSIRMSLKTSNGTNGTESVIPKTFTVMLPTAALIANLTSLIQSSAAALMMNQTAYADGEPSDVIEGSYLDYIDEVPTFCQAIVFRGRSFHQEWNQDVYNGLQTLATAISGLGYSLAQADLIGQDSTIRTITAVNNVVDAEIAWSNISNLPGRRSVDHRFRHAHGRRLRH